MFKDLLYSDFRTLCPMVFTKNPNRIQETIPSGQESGTYMPPANGIVKIVGHCCQIEIYNKTTGEAYSFANADNVVLYKAATVFVNKGDEVTWQLTGQSGRNTNLYFYYSEFEAP